jgi:hypothetical protein
VIASISVSTSKQVALKLFALVIILSLIQVFTYGCSSSDVSVDRKKPDIKIRYFDPQNFEGKSPAPDLKPGESALTEWEFGCQTNFEFDITEESRMSTGKNFVRLKIKSVKMILNAPILVWLPKNAAPDVVAHEKGHQDICTRVYSESDEIARKAAQSVVGKLFEAEADTREEACKKALIQAQEAVCAIYHQDVSDYAGCISEIYDSLDETEKGEAQELVRKAFSNYKRVSDKKK